MNRRQRKKLRRGEYDPAVWVKLFTTGRPTVVEQVSLGFRYRNNPEAAQYAIAAAWVQIIVKKFVEGPEMKWE